MKSRLTDPISYHEVTRNKYIFLFWPNTYLVRYRSSIEIHFAFHRFYKPAIFLYTVCD